MVRRAQLKFRFHSGVSWESPVMPYDLARTIQQNWARMKNGFRSQQTNDRVIEIRSSVLGHADVGSIMSIDMVWVEFLQLFECAPGPDA